MAFVYVASPMHETFRTMTRETPLCEFAIYEMPDRSLIPPFFLTKWERKNPNPWDFILGGGIHMASRNVGAESVSLGLDSHMGPAAPDLLAFGLGVLRPKFYSPTVFEQAMATFGERIEPPEKISGKGLETRLDILVQMPSGIEIYESTNLIHGDAYGELEQLRSRFRDEAMLAGYLSRLQESATIREGNWTYSGLGCMWRPLVEAWETHKNAYGQWNEPPKTVSELMMRVTEILEDTTIVEYERREAKSFAIR